MQFIQMYAWQYIPVDWMGFGSSTNRHIIQIHFDILVTVTFFQLMIILCETNFQLKVSDVYSSILGEMF